MTSEQLEELMIIFYIIYYILYYIKKKLTILNSQVSNIKNVHNSNVNI